MISIELEKSSAVFLNHRELINSTMNCREILDGPTRYELKEELFYYLPRVKQQHQIVPSNQTEFKVESHILPNPKTNANCTSSISRKALKSLKRSAKALGNDGKADECNLQKLINNYILEIRLRGILPSNTGSYNQSLPRHWEETHEFPKFKGSNNNRDHQIVKFNEVDYIIPPNSQFHNVCISELPKLVPELQLYDLIVLDPPWRNKYIRRIKRVRQDLGYQMLSTESLREMPIGELIHTTSIVAIWCTNSKGLQNALLDELLPSWNLRLVHCLKWIKLNSAGDLIKSLNVNDTTKKPYEMLYLACHKHRQHTPNLTQHELLISVPSIIHSHKPPLLPWLKQFLSESPKCLEIFARYLQPHFTSIGLEVVKLMDTRLYDKKTN